MTKKMTKKEMFAVVRGIVVASEECTEEVLAFIDHEVELLDRKSSATKPTKSQIENEKIMALVLECLAQTEKPLTISEMWEQFEVLKQYSNQKLSALLRILKEEGKVVKTIDKKKSYFSLAEQQVGSKAKLTGVQFP